MSVLLGGIKKQRLSISGIILIGFLTVILLGTLLLSLPVSARNGTSANLETSFFTAVASTCITGLSVVDTGSYWSGFAQVVILILIQTGGLGFMALWMMIFTITGKRASPRIRMMAAQSLNLPSSEGIWPLVMRMLRGTFIIEGVGALLLMVRFIPMFGFGTGIKLSVFHSISAFCNAGIDLMGAYYEPFGSFSAFSGDIWVNIVLCMLVLTGGIGFVVWSELIDCKKYKKKLSLYSKMAVSISLALVVFGTAAILLLEYNNPCTLGALNPGSRVLSAFFHSVNARTCGFTTLKLSDMNAFTILIISFLMFVLFFVPKCSIL